MWLVSFAFPFIGCLMQLVTWDSSIPDTAAAVCLCEAERGGDLGTPATASAISQTDERHTWASPDRKISLTWSRRSSPCFVKHNYLHHSLKVFWGIRDLEAGKQMRQPFSAVRISAVGILLSPGAAENSLAESLLFSEEFQCVGPVSHCPMYGASRVCVVVLFHKSKYGFNVYISVPAAHAFSKGLSSSAPYLK